MSPSAAINPSTGETYVFWTETNGNQDQWGIYGQMFNTSGERQWTDSGLELVPLGSQQTSFATALVNELGVFAAYLINPSAASLRVFRLGFDGTPSGARLPWQREATAGRTTPWSPTERTTALFSPGPTTGPMRGYMPRTSNPTARWASSPASAEALPRDMPCFRFSESLPWRFQHNRKP